MLLLIMLFALSMVGRYILYHVMCIVFFMGCLDWEGWLGLIRFVGRIVSTRLVLAVVVFFCVGRYKGLRAGVHTYIIVVFRPFVLQEF